MGTIRQSVAVALGAFVVVACSGEPAGVLPSDATSPSARPVGSAPAATDRDAASDPKDPDASAPTPATDASPDAPGPPPPECAAPDVPVCGKVPSSDAACSLFAPPSTPYGCANDIGNGCTELASKNGWCCPTPTAGPACSMADPFCASVGAAACGRPNGCVTSAPGCQHFASQGVWCCP